MNNRLLVIIRRICRGIITMWYIWALVAYEIAVYYVPNQYVIYFLLAPLFLLFMFMFYMVGRSEERDDLHKDKWQRLQTKVRG